MATKNPRVMVVLESPLYRWIRRSAKKQGVSISMKLRDIVREAFESYEDRYWAGEGEKRLQSFNRDGAIPHDQFWKKVG